MMKNKKSNNFKKSFSINNRALKLIYKKYPSMIISTVLNSIWKAINPYVLIYLSALIIEELAGSRNIEQLKIYVIITITIGALIALISALLKKWNDISTSNLFFKFEKIYTEKLLDMDFVSLDDSKTYELLSTIRQNQNGGGWGFYKVVTNYGSLVTSIFTLLGGITLTFTLFISKVPESNQNFTFLNHPLFIILVVLIMVY